MRKRWLSFALSCFLVNGSYAIEQSVAIQHRLYTNCLADTDRSGADCHAILQMLVDAVDVKAAESIIEEKYRREHQALFEQN